MFAPTIESWPPTDETFTPTICAAVNAAVRSDTYWGYGFGGIRGHRRRHDRRRAGRGWPGNRQVRTGIYSSRRAAA